MKDISSVQQHLNIEIKQRKINIYCYTFFPKRTEVAVDYVSNSLLFCFLSSQRSLRLVTAWVWVSRRAPAS